MIIWRLLSFRVELQYTVISILSLKLILLLFFQYCFEIYSADNSSGLIKACKTDSEGKVVEGIVIINIL